MQAHHVIIPDQRRSDRAFVLLRALNMTMILVIWLRWLYDDDDDGYMTMILYDVSCTLYYKTVSCTLDALNTHKGHIDNTL